MFLRILKIGFLSAVCAGSSACAGLKKYTAEFESRWKDETLFEKSLEGEAALQRNDAIAQALIEAGAVEGKNCDEARVSARRAMMLAPESEWPQVVLAECDLSEGRAREALASLSRLEQLKTEPRVLLAKGIANIRLGDYKLAIEDIEEALRRDTHMWRGWNSLGIAFDMAGRHEDAASVYETAAELNTTSGAAYNNMGMSYLQQGKTGEAITAFRKSLERDPRLAAARLNLRVAYAMDGQYEEAIAGVSEAEKASVYNNTGVAAMRRGEYDRARYFFQKALEVSPVYYAVAADNLQRLPHN